MAGWQENADLEAALPRDFTRFSDDYIKKLDVMGASPNAMGLVDSAPISPVTDYLRIAKNDLDILKTFRGIYGRDPTSAEFTQFADLGSGAKAAIATAYQNDPAARNAELAKKAGQYSGTVNDLFNQLLKRGATEAEIQHFGKLLASGEVDPYELNSFIQATPEYQQNADKTFREGLASELQGYDQKFFNRGKEDVISRFASMGRTGSTALDFALTDLMGKIADQRGQYLADLSTQQYGGNKAMARADYEGNMNAWLNNEAARRNANSTWLQRAWDLQDYNIQADNYQRYLDSQKRNRGAGAGAGAIAGLQAGAMTGNPWVAAGGAVGGGLFGYFGS